MSNRIQVNVTRGVTNIVQVNTLGPKGDKGDKGLQASPESITGSLHLTGSLTVSSSNVNFSNASAITGSTFSGSLFIGKFQGNGSLLTAITASAQPSGPNTSIQFRDTTDNSGSSDFTFNKSTGGVFIGGALTASVAISSSGTVTGLTGSFSHLKGNSPITVGDIIVFQQAVSGSVFSGSFVGNASGLTGVVAAGTLSSSAQIASDISGSFGVSSASFSTRVSANEVITAKTLVSGSSQITYSSISSIPSGIISGSAQLPSGIYSSSLQTLGNITSSGNISATGTISATGNISSSAELLGNDVRVNNVLYIESKRVNLTNNDLTIVDTGLNVLGGHITASSNISASGNLIGLDLNLFGGDIDLKNAGAQSNVKFYCESSNAHYTKLQAALHADYSGNPTTTLPAYDFNFKFPSFDANITASGNISSSGNISATGTISATGNISSSGQVFATEYKINGDVGLSTDGTTTLLLGNSNTITKIGYGRNTSDSHNFSGHITASGVVSASAFVGDGSGLTDLPSSGAGGIFVATGSIHSTANNLRITGSVFIDDTTTNSGSAAANAVFKVKGTQGDLFTLTNDLSDNLLNVKDISGVSVLQVSGSGEVLLKDLPTTQPNTTGSLWISGSGTPPGAAGSGYLMIFVG